MPRPCRVATTLQASQLVVYLGIGRAPAASPSRPLDSSVPGARVTQRLETSRALHGGACLYCRATLGRNDVLATVPVGGRIGFDAVQRRLWIVCSSCRRWNLSAAYALPEAFEECERHHREAAKLQWSESVTLARHPNGIELIRVGRASPVELAVWRYGSSLARTQWRRASFLLGEAAEDWLTERRDRLRRAYAVAPYVLGGLAAGGLSSTSLAQSSALALVLLAFFKLFTMESEEHEKQLARLSARSGVVLGRIGERAGGSFLLHADQAWRSRLVSGPEPARWRLSVPTRAGGARTPSSAYEVEGHDAVRALRLALCESGPSGGATAAVRRATAAIESVGGASAFLAHAPAETRARGFRYAALGELPSALRLPLEIAADEAHERRAIEDEPAVLDREWREAEALAALSLRERTEATSVLGLTHAPVASRSALEGS